MSYLGYVTSVCRDHLAEYTFPKVLEIGVEYGQTTLPLIQNLASRFEYFLYMGVDVLIRPETVERVTHFANINVCPPDKPAGRDVIFYQDNSLNWLQNNQSTKFDIIFLDGDHNYFTVINELKLIQAIIKPTSIIICDDYNGRWAKRDMFYANRKEYELVEIATQNKFSEKQGVKNAIDDFINSNKNVWDGFDIAGTDPMVLFQKDIYDLRTGPSFEGPSILNMQFPLKKLDN